MKKTLLSAQTTLNRPKSRRKQIAMYRKAGLSLIVVFCQFPKINLPKEDKCDAKDMTEKKSAHTVYREKKRLKRQGWKRQQDRAAYKV